MCRTKLVVPTPKTAPPEAAPPVAVAPAPPYVMPALPYPQVPPFVPGVIPPQYAPPMPMSPVPGVPLPPTPFNPLAPSAGVMHEDVVPSVVRRTRKKSNVSGDVWKWTTIGVILLLVGGIAFLFFNQRPKIDPLKGELTASRLSDGKLEPVLIHRDWIQLEEEVVETVLKEMEKRAVTLKSESLILRFQGNEQGIKITAAPGPRADLIAVNILDHKALAAWYKRESAPLADTGRKDATLAAKRFVQDWAQAEARGDKKPDFSRYHDDLGLTALASGVGNEIIAIVGETIYRCVAEQGGRLYFLLPSGTQRFELQGRDHGKGHILFPGHFRVKVVAEAETPKKSDKPKPDDKSKDDGDMKPKSETPSDSSPEPSTENSPPPTKKTSTAE